MSDVIRDSEQPAGCSAEKQAMVTRARAVIYKSQQVFGQGRRSVWGIGRNLGSAGQQLGNAGTQGKDQLLTLGLGLHGGSPLKAAQSTGSAA